MRAPWARLRERAPVTASIKVPKVSDAAYGVQFTDSGGQRHRKEG
jgi:hypothetical protein